MPVRLTVTAGPYAGREFTFAGHDRFIVGRAARCHLALPREDPYFSRSHLMIEVNPPHACVSDLGSRNGTFVNGHRVESAALHDGDAIRAGHTILVYRYEEAAHTDTIREALPPIVAEAVKPASPPTLCPACGKRPPSDGPFCRKCNRRIARYEQNLPGYTLVRELGRGGMGVVMLAVRTADHRPVAVKILTPHATCDVETVRRFVREAHVLGRLRHPAVVELYDAGEAGSRLYFAMELVRGPDAERLLAQRGRLPLKVAVHWVCQILDALAHAHAAGFVHRDVKPSNLLAVAADGGRSVKLADFGLARAYQMSQLSGVTQSGEFQGSAAFLPPEQITGFRHVTPAADQYATAATLYNLLTGRFVYDLPPGPEAYRMILEDEPIPLRLRRPELPRELGRVVGQALRRDPAERYPDAAAFRGALLPFAN